MRSGPIIMHCWSVRNLLAGRKSQTRPVVKPQPEFIYRLTDDTIAPVHIDIGAFNEINKAIGRSDAEVYPCFTEPRLHGGLGWACVLTDEVQRLWEEGVRGLVSVARSQKQEGIFNCIVVPQQRKGDEARTPAGVHGIPRNAGNTIASGAPSGWEPSKQHSRQPEVGNTGGELAGSEGSRTRHEGRETSCVEAYRQGARAYQVGDPTRIVQPTTCCASPWDEPSCNTTYCRYEIGSLLWVREEFAKDGWQIWYRADCDKGPANEVCQYQDGSDFEGVWRPSTQMPRWASRITLRLTDVRVERIQQITCADAIAEGIMPAANSQTIDFDTPDPRARYRAMWNYLNGRRGYPWESNPWVWRLSFDVIPKNVDDVLAEAERLGYFEPWEIRHHD